MATKNEEKDLKWYSENEVTEQIDLLNEFLKTEKNNLVKVSLNFNEKDLIDTYSEIIQSISLLYDKLLKYYRYEFDNKVGDWKRDEDGFPEKIPITKEERQIVLNSKLKSLKLLSAKLESIQLTSRNSPKNHFANIFSNYSHEREGLIEQQENKSMLQKIKDKISGDEDTVYEEE